MRAGASRPFLSLLLLFLAAADLARSQDEADSFGEVIDVRVVNVEVVVTDDQGRPVDGLSREDFRLRVDGEPRELSNFYAVSNDPQTSRSSGAEAVETVLPPDATRGLTVVVLVDNSNIRPENRKALFDRLREHLERLEQREAMSPREDPAPPPIRYMIASQDRALKLDVALTDDLDEVTQAFLDLEHRGSLFAALDGSRRMFLSRLGHASLRRYQPRQGALSDPEFDDAIRVALDLSIDVRSLAEERYQAAKRSFAALTRLCDALGGLRGRKALLYLSDGLPLRPADSLIDAWTGKYQQWAFQNSDDIRLRSRFPEASGDFQRLMSSIGSSQFDLQDQLDRMVTRAASAKVAFYPISAGGRNSGFISAEISGAGMHGDVGSGGMYRGSAMTESMTRDASLLRMAEDTGGAALLRSTAIDDFLDQMRRDFMNYYSLGFAPPNDVEDGLLHDLKVEVLHPGLQVRHAKGYVSKTWRQRLEERTAAAAVYDHHTNPLQVEVDPGVETAEGNGFTVPLMIKIPFEQIQLVHKDGHFNAQLTVLVLVSDRSGGQSETRRIDIPIKIPDTRVLEVVTQKAAYPLDLRMNKGPKRIAIGVRDHISGAESAVTLELSVGRGVQQGT